MTKLNPCPKEFIFSGIHYITISEMENIYTRCLALPCNVPGFPKWFSNEQMGNLVVNNPAPLDIVDIK